MYTLRRIAEISAARKMVGPADRIIKTLVVDSRPAFQFNQALFVALKGDKSDGHQYLQAAYQKGIRDFLVARLPKDVREYQGAGFVVVDNTLDALQKLASYHRSQFRYPLIAITGSNGKTIVKEWLSQLLSGRFYVVKSPKSFNSQIGVPLSVWEMSDHYEMGVFEAGISMPREMARLNEVLKPNIGLFTTLGSAHEENFPDQETKMQEKALLFTGCQRIIFPADEPLVQKVLSERYPPAILFGWSMKPNNQAPVKVFFNGENEKGFSIYSFHFDDNLHFEIETLFKDKASVQNLIQTVICGYYAGLVPDEIKNGIKLLRNVPSRLQVREGHGRSVIVDDTYNNDWSGLRVALDYQSSFQLGKRKILVVSDIQQTASPAEVYARLAQACSDYGVEMLYTVGHDFKKYFEPFSAGIVWRHFDNTDALIGDLRLSDFEDSIILVKGGRFFRFERIVAHLSKSLHSTRFEINLESLIHNLRHFKTKLRPETRMMAMVKASAYGAGAVEVAKVLQFHGVDYLAVAYAGEGVILREAGILLPIMVMNSQIEHFEQLISNNLEPEIYSLSMLNAIGRFSHDTGKQIKIHMNIDTGMNRLGFNSDELELIPTIMQQYPHLRIASIYTHLVGSDEAHLDQFSREQIRTFEAGARFIEMATGSSYLKHVLNTAGIRRFPDAQFDMVRLGLGLYGVGDDSGLQQAGRLITTISQIKEVRKGASIGYSRKGVVKRDSIIAVLAIGYADGLDRRFGNTAGGVFIHGQYAPIVGQVCMDMTMVDITDLKGVHEGDEVEVFGFFQSFKDAADRIRTIPYELLTGISERVQRTFFWA
jgi:alanine racemase